MNTSPLDEKLNNDQKLEEQMIALDWYKFQQRIQPLPWKAFLDFHKSLCHSLNNQRRRKPPKILKQTTEAQLILYPLMSYIKHGLLF